MSDYKVSNRYASSLLETSISNNSLETVSKDIQHVHSTLSVSDELVRALKSPVINSESKLVVLKEIFKDKVSDETIRFFDFLIEKDRENLLAEIADQFLSIKDEYLGIINVAVTTAFEFDDEQKEQLKVKFENYLNKKVKINFKLDKNVLGGFIAKVGDTVYDASIKHQLELLKQKFIQGEVSLN